MADNETTGVGKAIATDKVTYSGDASQNVQLVKPVLVTGSEGSKTVIDLAGGPGQSGAGLRVIEGFPPNAYSFLIPSQVHVAGANTVHWDLFNADASKVVRVVSIRQIPNITTAVTGVVFDWLLERTTSVGTGGSALTAWLADLNDTALDADITCRSKPTGGAAESINLFNYALSSEETNAATISIASQGGLELVPPHLLPLFGGKGIVLRQDQGLRCVQVTNSAQGNTGWLINFTVDP